MLGRMNATQILESLRPAFVTKCGSYQFAVEPLTDALFAEFKELPKRHWEEMPEFHLGETYNPDVRGRQELIASGDAVLCTVRDADLAPAGYCILFFYVSNLSGVRMCREDLIFIGKKHRNGRLFYRFVEFAHMVARVGGAQKFRVHACEGTRSLRMFESLFGYQKLATIMEVRL
jgi:hypothetical protein